MLAEIAIRNRETVLGRTQEIATENLRLVDAFMAEHADTFGWIAPRGGMTAFPWLLHEADSRPFCEAASEQGILLAPGDCFGMPAHFRLGFAAVGDKLPIALERLGRVVRSWSDAKLTKA